VIDWVDSAVRLSVTQSARLARCSPAPRGFTLLELLVVVLILGLLTSYVAPRLFGQISRSERQSALLQMNSLSKALDAFRLDVGRYPVTSEGLGALTKQPAGATSWRGPYLQSDAPRDPWGNGYVYRSPGIAVDYDLLSYGKDGVAGGEGDAADIRQGSSR
jgi:general secretion pathway protein G